jgi:hypothetical protein
MWTSIWLVYCFGSNYDIKYFQKSFYEQKIIWLKMSLKNYNKNWIYLRNKVSVF